MKYYKQVLSKRYAFVRIFISYQFFFSWLINRVYEEEEDEFEDKDEDEQLSSNQGTKMEKEVRLSQNKK